MKNLCNGGGVGRILLVIIILMASIHGHGRGRRHYRNTLMKMHYHSWSVSDLLEGLLIMIQNWLVPDSSATKAQSRDSLLFLFDGQNNGSSNFLGLNVSQRNVAYVSTYLRVRTIINKPRHRADHRSSWVVLRPGASGLALLKVFMGNLACCTILCVVNFTIR